LHPEFVGWQVRRRFWRAHRRGCPVLTWRWCWRLNKENLSVMPNMEPTDQWAEGLSRIILCARNEEEEQEEISEPFLQGGGDREKIVDPKLLSRRSSALPQDFVVPRFRARGKQKKEKMPPRPPKKEFRRWKTGERRTGARKPETPSFSLVPLSQKITGLAASVFDTFFGAILNASPLFEVDNPIRIFKRLLADDTEWPTSCIPPSL